jgi:uncharacterized protein (TIGR02301 family)
VPLVLRLRLWSRRICLDSRCPWKALLGVCGHARANVSADQFWHQLRYLQQDLFMLKAQHLLSILLVVSALTAAGPAFSQTAQSLENRPYDEKLLRLTEVLGAVHFLRELCGGTDGQLWRERMRELLDAEGTSALRKARLTRAFNNGYRSYSRTYQTCTPSAQTAVAKFMGEAAEIAETLVKTVP